MSLNVFRNNAENAPLYHALKIYFGFSQLVFSELYHLLIRPDLTKPKPFAGKKPPSLKADMKESQHELFHLKLSL